MQKLRIILLFLFISSIILIGCDIKEKEYEYEEITVNVITGEYNLPGILTLPISNKKVPAVVFVHGSGANDMHETVGKLRLFEDLAKKLAVKGIASIRYDKRSYVYANELVNKLDFTIYDEVIDDAVSAIKLLENNERIKDIYIIGHSFGGQLAPIIANKTNVKGVIVLAGTTEHIIDLAMSQLLDQNSPYYNLYDPYDEYFKTIKEVKSEEIGYYFMGAYETYWVSYNNLDITNQLIECAKNKKMLVLQGMLDLQVKGNEIEKYKNILNNTNTQYKTYEFLNHMFVDGVGETIQTAYQNYKEVSDEVVDDISNFIKE